MTEQNSLSLTDSAVLKFLTAYIYTHGRPPSYDDIAVAVFLSKSAVKRHLDKLEDAGYLTREAGKVRAIRLVERRGAAD